MIFIIVSQLIVVNSLITLYVYRCQLFKSMFSLLSSAIILALIPNFITSLLLGTNQITNTAAQIQFGITGFITSVFIWYILKDTPCS